jgi:CheY-like chemotaxis protein
LPRKILLADDSVTAQNMGRKILADAGYDVLTVNNGSAALKKIGEHKPDLIVLDVYMPGYSGLEVCQRLKEAGETARIPILLTVGKLEPFKPEEAKRVRADGFIVKPFEASELLGVLSKLEDKIVPTPESPRPGRFARVAAAIEEQSGKTAPAESGSGWKNRIAFPSQKPESKSKKEEADDNDSAIYNPVNRDLRTTIASKPAEKVPAAKSAATINDRVDLGVLATPGLPADVTTEEIAALAAAAAQMKGKAAEVPTTEAQTTEVAGIKTEAQATTGKIEEAKTETSEMAVVAPQPETLQPESGEQRSSTPFEVVATVATPAQEPAAQLVPESIPSPTDAKEESSTPDSGEPVTMAVATGSAPSPSAQRWTAVSVALDPEETSLTLEQEMQRAQAVVAVSEQAVAAPPAEISAPEAVTASAPADTVAEKVDLSSLTEAVPDAIQSFASATETLSAAVEKLEAAACAHIEQQSSPVETALPPQSEPSAPSTESNPAAEASAETPVAAATIEVQTEPASASVAPPLADFAPAGDFSAIAESQPASESQQTESREMPRTEEWHESCPAQVLSVAEVSAALAQPGLAQESGIQDATAQDATAQDAVAGTQTIAAAETEVHKEATNSEAEIVATTAAAWASWRRIRESGDAKPTPPADSSQQFSSQPESREMSAVEEKAQNEAHDEAAMAAAVGGGNGSAHAAAAEATAEALANIVDSILADMRPKILEEVSKKLRTK